VSDADALVIRLATVADAPALAALRYDFRVELAPAAEPRPEFEARCRAWMAERLRPGGAWRCWIAGSSAAIDATLWAERIEKMPNPVAERELHVYITNFYVQPSARGSGLGNRMLTVALDWCRAEAVDAVILWPSPRSRSLYLRHGFAVRDDVLELRLAAAPGHGEPAPPPRV